MFLCNTCWQNCITFTPHHAPIIPPSLPCHHYPLLIMLLDLSVLASDWKRKARSNDNLESNKVRHLLVEWTAFISFLVSSIIWLTIKYRIKCLTIYLSTFISKTHLSSTMRQDAYEQINRQTYKWHTNWRQTYKHTYKNKHTTDIHIQMYNKEAKPNNHT